MSIAIYCRVSSRSQDVASQLPDLERWGKQQEEPVIWYRDKFTGKSMDRPGMNRLMADIRAGKIKTLAVWRIDRCGRTAKGLTALFEELQSKGVNFVSLRDGLDLSTPAGRLMANVLASVAAYETEIRRERTLAGQMVARANGKTWGGRKKGQRVSVTDEQVATVVRLNREKVKKAKIARAVGLSRQTIYRILAEGTDQS